MPPLGDRGLEKDTCRDWTDDWKWRIILEKRRQIFLIKFMPDRIMYLKILLFIALIRRLIHTREI